MSKTIIDFIIEDINLLNQDTFVLKLKSNVHLPEILPGQFVNVKIDQSHSTFLRRPISVHDVDYNNSMLYLYIKKVGCGTNKLSEYSVGDRLNIILPLGNTFNLKYTSNPLLIGGGCGVAPLFYLAKDIVNKTGRKPSLIIGARKSNDILQINEFEKYANVYLTTEDGSKGERGFPTNHSILELKRFDFIYTCGPEAMMKAVAQYAKKRNIECEVSLENTMACGIGACLCCVQDTKDGNKCVCTEGPVFNINDLKW